MQMRRPTEHVENDQSEICNLIYFKRKRISVPDLVSCSEARQKLDRNWSYMHIGISNCIGFNMFMGPWASYWLCTGH